MVVVLRRRGCRRERGGVTVGEQCLGTLLGTVMWNAINLLNLCKGRGFFLNMVKKKEKKADWEGILMDCVRFVGK